MVAVASGQVEFQRERFTKEFEAEVLPLGEMHNREIGGVIADVRIRVPREMYESLDSNDMLRIYTLRQDGALKGYNIFAVIVHPEYGKPTAQHDVMFLHPDVRSGFNASRFLRWCDEQLKEDGVLFVTQHVTASKDFSPLLKRIGYQHSETVYIKRLN
jgi:hypothetical protein